MAAIKDDDAETARDNFREPANHAGRIGELKFWSRFPDLGNLAFVHEHHNSVRARIAKRPIRLQIERRAA
jgi:hypothetical protein